MTAQLAAFGAATSPNKWVNWLNHEFKPAFDEVMAGPDRARCRERIALANELLTRYGVANFDAGGFVMKAASTVWQECKQQKRTPSRPTYAEALQAILTASSTETVVELIRRTLAQAKGEGPTDAPSSSATTDADADIASVPLAAAVQGICTHCGEREDAGSSAASLNSCSLCSRPFHSGCMILCKCDSGESCVCADCELRRTMDAPSKTASDFSDNLQFLADVSGSADGGSGETGDRDSGGGGGVDATADVAPMLGDLSLADDAESASYAAFTPADK